MIGVSPCSSLFCRTSIVAFEEEAGPPLSEHVYRDRSELQVNLTASIVIIHPFSFCFRRQRREGKAGTGTSPRVLEAAGGAGRWTTLRSGDAWARASSERFTWLVRDGLDTSLLSRQAFYSLPSSRTWKRKARSFLGELGIFSHVYVA